ncbi:hypothetical protein DID88_000915 [Monilinia fructigena]|uniref:Uncharacterized protein n=1 Tax=Monilinia fructigena TaxID=38457 RepID=A0A395IYJ7_9HELO|nr:hypothetical protein DID88_000915 [Monilinia fructigena]
MVGRRGHPAAGDVPFGGDDPDLEFDVPSDSTNIRNAISKYVRMVYLHINTDRALNLPGINSHCALIPGGFWDPARGTFAASPSHANWDATGISPVTAIEFYTRLATTIPTHNITPLMIHGFATLGTKDLANQTTYIFMPVTDLRYGRRIPHHTLIVYFPITKTIDWLDSRHGDMGPHNYHFAALFAGIVFPDMGLVGQVLNFVSQFIGPTTKNNREFNPCDWRMRFNGSDRQNDTEPSGLPWPANEAESAAMVCTSALCIAAGYNLDYLPKYDLVNQAVWMGERRGRIAMELHQGRRSLPPAVGPPSCPLNYPIESPLNILTYHSDDDNFQFFDLEPSFKRPKLRSPWLPRRDRARWYRGGKHRDDTPILDNYPMNEVNGAEGLKQLATRIQLPRRTILAREGKAAFRDAIEQYQYNLRGTRGGPRRNGRMPCQY